MSEVDIEEIIRRARSIDKNIELIEKRHEEELKQYRDVRMQYRNFLQEYLVTNHMRSAITKAGKAVLATKTSFRVEDPTEFKRHIIGTEDWDTIVWAVKRSAAERYEETTGALPPGVAKTSILELRLLAPAKKQIHKPTNEGEQTFDAFEDETIETSNNTQNNVQNNVQNNEQSEAAQ